MPLNPQKLADFLLQNNILGSSQIQTCLQESAEDQKSFLEKILEHHFLTEDRLGKIIEQIYQIKYVKLSSLSIPDNIIQEIPYNMALSQGLIVFDKNESTISIATSDPENQEGINFIRQKSGLKTEIYFTTPEEIRNKLKSYRRDIHERFDKLVKNIKEESSQAEDFSNAAPLLDAIISLAYEQKASDIHIEPHKKTLLIRYRVDGLLQDITNLPKELQDLIVTRIKVLANLRTDEHRAPQDGRFKMDIDGEELTLRVSIVPIYDGEKIVLRLLASENKTISLEDLGYNAANLVQIRDGATKSHGMILVTGPTGSGKTTTLYAILKELNSREVNISTIEDPIEYRLEGVNQIQANRETGLSFAAGLRSLLRQDPDIIMVGEIRDNETAGIAVNAALTGHLVLATLHTNNAASTLVRLIEMGIEPFLVSSTVIVAIAQRLVRKICANCRQKYEFNKSHLLKLAENLKLNMSSVEKLHQALLRKNNQSDQCYFYHGLGCQNCHNTGYIGRFGIAEVITVDEEIRKLILNNASPDVIEAKAVERGTQSMFDDGIEKALNGSTTLEEVLRVIRE